MEIYFKEGDLVSCQGLGNGVVTKIEGNKEYYPLLAKFSGMERSFTIDGRIYLEDLYPSLFQGHNRFDPSPNKPIFEPKQGELVWAKVKGTWVALKYFTIDTFHLVRIVSLPNGDNIQASEIRPFKGEIPND